MGRGGCRRHGTYICNNIVYIIQLMGLIINVTLEIVFSTSFSYCFMSSISISSSRYSLNSYYFLLAFIETLRKIIQKVSWETC